MGTLKEGTSADITILKLEDQTMAFEDKYHNQIMGNRVIKPMATMINGRLLYCSSDVLEKR